MRKVEYERWLRYFEARDQGLGPARAASKARLSEATAWRFERGDPTCSGLEVAAKEGRTLIGGKVVASPISPEAVKALEDFAYFRMRYFGRKSTPWQERAAYDILRMLQTEVREYAVINAPPGSGKSTLFTHDIICWLIARDRTIRIMIGSRTERQARMYVSRIKKSLERESPLLADPDAVARGEAYDAEATMSQDFGGFKPEGRGDLWRGEALVVRQITGQALDDKEQTVSAWGQDSGFLGGRYDMVMWDDLVDSKNTKTLDAVESLTEWWTTEAESRLEPRGLLVLQGQRIAHDDLYSVCLKFTKDESIPKYHHVVYQAHTEELCKDEHSMVEAWPNGCLLDPYRLPWDMLREIQRNSPRKFEVMYQQNDGDGVGGLIDPAWITGGVDEQGYPCVGSLDRDRTVGEVPGGLDTVQCWSFVTVDPSPTEFWGVIWWLYDPATQQRHIIDSWRLRMNPEDFLSLNLDNGEFSGLMVETKIRSHEYGIPLTDVIVEVNAAQRWLLAQPHVQKWSQYANVRFMPHTTGFNKSDPKFGVESIGDVFRQGKIRMPYSTPTARQKMQFIIDEGTRYPDSKTTDMVMSIWFGHLAINTQYTPRTQGRYRHDVPRWLRGATRGMGGLRVS